MIIIAKKSVNDVGLVPFLSSPPAYRGERERDTEDTERDRDRKGGERCGRRGGERE